MRLCVILVLAAIAGLSASGKRFFLENSAVWRVMSTESGTLRTEGLMNKRAGLAIEPRTRPVNYAYVWAGAGTESRAPRSFFVSVS